MHLTVDAALLIGLIVATWTLCLSENAQYRLRGIVFSDEISGYLSSAALSGPLAQIVAPLDSAPRGLGPPWLEKEFMRRIPKNKHLLCIGEPFAPTPAARWTTLWNSHPDRRMVMAEKARYLPKENLDKEFIASAELIDPGNGYYRLLALIKRSDGMVSRDYYRRRARGSATTVPFPEYTILDEAALDDCFHELERILAMDQLDPRRANLIRQRLAHWPELTNFDDLARDAYWNHVVNWDGFSLLPLIEAFQAKSCQFGNTGDAEEMRKLCGMWRKLQRRLLNIQTWPAWIESSSFYGNPGVMLEVSQHLNLREEERFFAASRATRIKSLAGFEAWTSAPDGSRLSISWTDEGATARLAEHRMFEGLYCMAAAGSLLCFIIVVILIRVIFARRLLGLPQHLSGLLGSKEHLRILAVGFLIPLGIVLLSLEIPVFHSRDEAITETHAGAVLLKLASLVTAIVLLTTREVMVSLQLRGHAIGFRPTGSKVLLGLAALALGTAFAATGLWHLEDLGSEIREDWVWLGFFSMLGLELLLLLVSAGMLLRLPGLRLQLATAAHLITRHLAFAALLLATMVPIYRMIESRELARATAERLDTPYALEGLQGISPKHIEMRRIITDYLDSGPTP